MGRSAPRRAGRQRRQDWHGRLSSIQILDPGDVRNAKESVPACTWALLWFLAAIQIFLHSSGCSSLFLMFPTQYLRTARCVEELNQASNLDVTIHKWHFPAYLSFKTPQCVRAILGAVQVFIWPPYTTEPLQILFTQQKQARCTAGHQGVNALNLNDSTTLKLEQVQLGSITVYRWRSAFIQGSHVNACKQTDILNSSRGNMFISAYVYPTPIWQRGTLEPCVCLGF